MITLKEVATMPLPLPRVKKSQVYPLSDLTGVILQIKFKMNSTTIIMWYLLLFSLIIPSTKFNKICMSYISNIFTFGIFANSNTYFRALNNPRCHFSVKWTGTNTSVERSLPALPFENGSRTLILIWSQQP